MTAIRHHEDAAMTAIPLSTPRSLARETERRVETVYALLAIFLAAVILAVVIWGLPALVLTAVALVPVVFFLFFAVSRP
ncbi:hypothetical protein [Tabrizicola sp.]|jgi:fatty acid desaturase|uniref:hypothetical protein n=1 Tax=Tabrizicola sp. TaxID=2005166 RepID=UPI0035B1E2D3